MEHSAFTKTKPNNLPEQLVWDVPGFHVHEFKPRQTKYCFIVVIWNEGERIIKQLQKMSKKSAEADIIIADGNSNDGSTAHEYLAKCGVRSLLVTSERGLCTATRMAIAYALEQGYEGIITVDGNNKDGVEAISKFIELLDKGYDLVQGSRFLPGARHDNTPRERYFAVRYIASPLLSIASGSKFTDVMNAFRACSRKFLLDSRVQPLRKEFVRFNLQQYLDYRAAKLDFKVTEIPVERVYPAKGPIPSKIVSVQTKALILYELLKVIIGAYSPK